MIAVVAYNQFGSGNGLVVHKDSPYFELSDLKGKRGQRAVRLGRARHDAQGACRTAAGRPITFSSCSQSPEVGSTNLQEKKIDAHADFVPFAELLPFRGFARKIFDGVETKPADLARRGRAQGLRREISGDRGGLHQGR